MMSVQTISGFVASKAYDIAVNTTMVVLQIQTWDRANMQGAVFSITATGKSYSATADASGRAEVVVDSGYTYTVSLTHNGTYLNDDDQVFVANSEEIVWVNFILSIPYDYQTTVVTVPAAGGTVSVSGIQANSLLWVAPDPSSHDVYAEAGCRCTSIGNGTATFAVTKTASEDMSVNLAWVARPA